MPDPLPPLNAIRVFEAAARHENFSRAADELCVTQSAVSRQVQRLEAQLGQKLFARNGPNLKLTVNGRAYLEVVQQGLAVIRRGTSRLFSRGPQPVLTLSVLPSFVSRWLMPRISAFERAHPGIMLRLSASYQVVDFAVSNDIDAAIRFGKGGWPGVTADLLVDDVVVPVCSPAQAARIHQPADLLRQRLFVEEPFGLSWGLWLEAAGLENRPRKEHTLSDDFSAQIQAARLGHGVALARGMLVADDVRSGQLVCPYALALRSPMQYYFVRPEPALADPKLELTKQWLQAEAAATVAGMADYWGEAVSVGSEALDETV